MNGKTIHGIMNVFYEDYYGENKGKHYNPYCVKCKTYEQSVEFINYLESLGFLVVERQSYDYCAVLVNFELKRCSGIRMACHYTTPDKEIDYGDFLPILKNYLNSASAGL